MTRLLRRLLLTSALLVAVALGGLLFLRSALGRPVVEGAHEQARVLPVASPRPNLVVILTDDQDAASLAFMPKVQALLADQGMSFTNAFVSLPQCCPSRATLLRGQYAHNHGVWGNGMPSGGWEKFHAAGLEESTLATWLQRAGYLTALTGKYLNNYPQEGDYVPPGWSEWYQSIGYTGYTMVENGQPVRYGKGPEHYSTDVIARKATEFIRRSSAAGRPFFLLAAPYAPHRPSNPARRHRGLLEELPVPHSRSFNEADVGDKPRAIRSLPPLSAQQVARIETQRRRQLETLLAVDEMVETLVATLEEVGALESTYILFTSDNGMHMGEHRLPPGKNTVYREDIQVPLVVRGPGVRRERREELVVNIDLAPTLAELAGLAAPAFVDGRSFAPLLHGGPMAWRRLFLVETGSCSQFWCIPGAFTAAAVRMTDTLYAETGRGEVELYDLRADPFELESRHGSADEAELERLSGLLEALRECAGTECRRLEDGAILTTQRGKEVR